VASTDQGRESFGQVAAQATSPGEFLELERAHDLADGFLPLDSVIGTVAIRALCGERPFSVDGASENGARGRAATLCLGGLTGEERALLEELFSLEKQRSRGSWSLPETVPVKLGRLHFAAYLRQHGRFFHESVEANTYQSVALAASPEAPLVHAVLNPFFFSLYEPFALRSGHAYSRFFYEGGHSPGKGKEKRIARWREVDDFFAALGLQAEAELSVVRPGGGWAWLHAPEQLAANAALAEAISREAQQLGPSMLAARYRAFRLRSLLERYYAKANKKGRALRRRVLTRKLELILSAFFGGDWLAFLNYIGEEPHPEEHVATALPETRLYLSPSRKVAEDLGAEGVTEEQLRLIARSLYGSETSPIERRLSTLKRYWEAFDAIHARQRSGMKPLLGLAEKHGRFGLVSGQDPDAPYRRGLYRQLLPADLLKEIDELWGTVMLPREPGRIVTEPFPHVGLALAFGSALWFWHECALTAWFLCEGPYSRIDTADLERYYRRELSDLENLAAPVDRKMFGELIAAEEHLGPEEPTYSETQPIEVEPGVTVDRAISRGSRRQGFERLRDIVTKYRRTWAVKYLDNYLRTRAEGDVREAAQTYYRKMAERGGKPPTPKQFAHVATRPTNRWFGGDVSALYRAFGERSPISPKRVRLIPENTESFVRRVYAALGGVEVGPPPLEWHDQQEFQDYYQNKKNKNFKIEGLATMALDYLRLEEMLGRAPTLKELGKDESAHRVLATALGTSVEKAWAAYETIVHDARTREETEKEPVRDIESCEHTRSWGGEDVKRHVALADERTRFSDDRLEQTAASGGTRGVPNFDKVQDTLHATTKKPWWRLLLGG